MSFDTIIKGGTIVTATETQDADVAVKNGRIAAIGPNLKAEGAGPLLLAGVVARRLHNSVIMLAPRA
jgi:dihydropyrimidinase